MVPLMGLGGAAGGDFGFPLQALEVPTWRLGFFGVPHGGFMDPKRRLIGVAPVEETSQISFR